MTTNRMSTVRFSAEDLALFSTASHDRNPLHLSDDYARRTPYGERVVFGVLGALACLGQAQPRPERSLASIRVDFHSPLFLRVDYAVRLVEPSAERCSATVYDGKQVILTLTATFREGALRANPGHGRGEQKRSEPADLKSANLYQGCTLRGSYEPDWESIRALSAYHNLDERGLGPRELLALLWCSYSVGMEMPGRRALFSRLALEFDESFHDCELSADYEATAQAFDNRFNLLSVSAKLSRGAGVLARADLRAFVREELPPVEDTAIEALLPRSEDLKGKVALVVGASRGLGAATARALALQGCTVFANYARSSSEADALRAEPQHIPGRIVPIQGDAGDPEWCENLKRTICDSNGRLDFLVCSAAPTPRPLTVHPATMNRIREYVDRSLVLVGTPLAAFVDLLAEHAGCGVIISSLYVRTAPAEWPHYVSAKSAIEGLTRVAAAQNPKVRFLLVRPPRLLTDMTNTPAPASRQDTISPAVAAVAIVAKLTRAAGEVAGVEVLEDFDYFEAEGISPGSVAGRSTMRT